MSSYYSIEGLDFWDYRHPTGIRFDTFKEAEAHVATLNAKNFDPLYCYIVTEHTTADEQVTKEDS